MNQSLISQVEQIGTGAAFILFPLIFIFAFSVHPGLLRPRLLKPEELIRRARRNKLLQFSHCRDLGFLYPLWPCGNSAHASDRRVCLEVAQR